MLVKSTRYIALILRPTAYPQHGADCNTVGIKEAPDGLDFFYASRSHALKLCDFLQSVVAVRSRADKQLVRNAIRGWDDTPPARTLYCHHAARIRGGTLS